MTDTEGPELPIAESEDQLKLFDVEQGWKKEWLGMPEFHQADLEPDKSVLVHFKNAEDRNAFSKLVQQPVTDSTRMIWYPKAEIGHMMDRAFKSQLQPVLRYPVYIISKGRWESRLTAKSLEAIGVPYRIVIEPQEFEQYAAVIAPDKILKLPFSNLGQGSIPARNWVWEHSLQEGHERHWILDDNINGFFRLHNNLKTPVADGAIFQAAEDFTERYKNIGQSGFNYFMFAPRKSPSIKPFQLNTRIYSCILNRNDLDFRWRGRYNEDTDLSIRILKAGLCTVLFNAFLAGKSQTMTMKGGNTDELYKDDGRLKMAESLRDQHPELVRIAWKFGRWQHHVNYRVFRNNKLIVKDSDILPMANNYGMELEIYK